MLGLLRSIMRRAQKAAKHVRLHRNFADIKTFCLFIGYPRSGTSLVSSLLDAHPNIIISDESHVVRCVQRGDSRNDIFIKLLNNSQSFGDNVRSAGGYTFEVPGQWQGRYRKLRVIGDKKASGSSLRLGRDPHLIEKLKSTLGDIDLRILHVIRNPFDNITTISLKHSMTMPDAIEHYFNRCRHVLEIKRRIPQDSLLDIRHEAIIDKPKQSLINLCNFFGVTPLDDYITACAGIIFKKPNLSRQQVPWKDEWLTQVNDGIAKIPYLSGYAFCE